MNKPTRPDKVDLPDPVPEAEGLPPVFPADQGFRVFLARAGSGGMPADPLVADQPDLAGRGELLMIVEDETAVRTVLRILLERAGYHVLECASGPAALELWGKYQAKIKLLITDMVMPGAFGGVQLAQKLLKERPDLKVIITSGYSTALSQDRRKFDVEIAFIPKPFEQKNVLRLVRTQLDRPGSPAGA